MINRTFLCEYCYYGCDGMPDGESCDKLATFKIVDRKDDTYYRFTCKRHKAETLKQFQNPKIERV